MIENGHLIRRLPEALDPLRELALDLRWTWSHASDALWRMLDPEIWERTENPWVILQSVPTTRLERLATDPAFLAELQRLVEERRAYLSSTGWFRRQYPEQDLSTIAYFSMEFGLGEALPIYAGGLGVLAGDLLKTASDLDMPVVGVGLLYDRGYFRQWLDEEGNQEAFYPFNDPTSLPVTPAYLPNGDWLHILLHLPGRRLRVRVWRAQVGRIPLYLLDSNDPMNSPVDRGITSELYAAGAETRLLQEIVLGIGGARVLEALRVPVDVCHLNEGHSAFCTLERARSFMVNHDVDFATACWATRPGNIFTTHTPVSAGFDFFPPALVARYLAVYSEELGVPMRQLLALGQDPAHGNNFSMACLALRMCGSVNGVSRLHGRVSRALFQPWFPRWPVAEVPIGQVTNGIHVASWDSPAADRLWTRSCGKARWLGELESLRESIDALPDTELWAFRTEGRQRLVEYVRRRYRRQVSLQGADERTVRAAEQVLDPNALTLGFARRFAEYKRPTLLLRDEDRLLRLLRDRDRPVQLVIAGKAHPQDRIGRDLVARIVRFSRRPEVQGRVIFLADYDMALAGQLVEGVDVWINTPRRPWEACGTSGMKVLVNGGLNLSVLDGWWDEAYSPEVGWAVGPAGAETSTDAADAEALYGLLEREVVPRFYDRDERGIPRRWVAMMRASMAQLAPRFSTNRMLQEYLRDYYLPAARDYRRRAAEGAALAMELERWWQRFELHWDKLHLMNLGVETEDQVHRFHVQVYLDDLTPDAVAVELYAEPLDGEGPERWPMNRAGELPGAMQGYLYQVEIPARRPAQDYTPRLVPHHPEARIPLEASWIRWYGSED